MANSTFYPTIDQNPLVEEGGTIVGRLRALSATRPDDIAYTFLMGREGEEHNITYRELDTVACSLAAHLAKLNGSNNPTAILAYEPGLDFIKSFFACLYAGWIAIPVNPPRRKNMAEKFDAIINDSGTSWVMSTKSLSDRLREATDGSDIGRAISWLETDELKLESVDITIERDIKPNSLALLQYTSGSISSPKGVMISHGNIIANQKMIKSAFEHNEQTVVVGWLPHFHDMGLIGNILQPLFCGCRGILMSPMYFLQKPVRWLKAITKYKATTSGGPNFAFDLCAREVDQKDISTLDLSSWDLAFCGAERIHPETLELFFKRFKACGFKSNSLYPCYGLAEVTLIATGGSKKEKPIMHHFDKDLLESDQAKRVVWRKRNTVSLTGCGRSILEGKVLIVNPKTLVPSPEQQVGEIWIAGENVAQGYWNRQEETQKSFNAFTSEKKGGPYFRSGDLGFIWRGELYVTGRLKELIIIRGQNIYPHDVEKNTTSCHPDLRPHSCISFSVTVQTEEQLVILAESKKRRMKNVEAVKEKIQQTIVEKYGIRAGAIEILDPLSLPRTSSGKLQRVLCREQYLSSIS